ncbi:UDP-glucuronate 4-epimerase [Rhizobiales bacterium GAS191]|jgi:UDP-glucuronate 4-epimerase|nr:UDP-glucuronate 4-epimerase [Rhizobiales bacterium GAS113]SEE24501.1 UDP-glucuronate 4-epimerase [Rhizobiales bacterium GAS191]SEE31966.1 UDP-glucuronate 4-epimerase [Rhizobiales bacterium GAS188]
MKIIVTGIAGFIGSHLARRLLSEGHDVVGIDEVNDYYAVSLKRDRLAEIAKSGAFEFVEADIADLPAMRSLFARHRDATHIVHLAAQAGVRYSIERPELYVHANVMGQVAVFEAALQLEHCAHLLYASTSSVYGANRELPFSTEQRVEAPVSLYSATKLAGEHIAYTYGHLHGVAATGFRFFTVYGPWGRPDMSYYKFAVAIAAGEPISIHGFGEMSRDFTYVDDVVAGLVAALPRPPAAGAGGVRHKVYNIGNNRPTPLLDFVDMVERAMGRKAQRLMVPMAPGEMVSTYADITETQRDFGFAPSTPVERGIEEFVRWFKSYHGTN